MSDPSVTAVKTLFAHSRNRCFFTQCEESLTDPHWKQVNAEIAHIKGERDGSARYDPDQDDTKRQGYENLMLLCPKHHKLIDRLEPEEYPVDRLLEIRAAHLTHSPEKEWCTEAQAEQFAQLALAILRDQRQPTLHVRSAKYGEQKTFADVTGIVQGMVKDNRLAFVVTNDALGGDPLENVLKKIEIQYSLDGQLATISVAENDQVFLP